ncbi:MAG: aminotransferase class V-fold PLP-dependent enzyme [Gemmatimonadales bacterium]
MTLPLRVSHAAIVDDDEGFFQRLRETEYSRLDAQDQAYLDFTGSALYAERQITANCERMRRSVFGNPHSENGPSRMSTRLIERAKSKLLAFLDASPDEYVVCFTANTSAAIKLVAEGFQFGERAPLVMSADNHNSVNGIREYARLRHARVHYLPLDDKLRLRTAHQMLWQLASRQGGLFAYPAQSNFSGVKHSLELISAAQRLGFTVLLDAAAFLPTNMLSLRRYPADFVALSAYKIAGYPTGVGALVARRDALAHLQRPWFAGGTVDYASVQQGTHLLSSGAEGFEDGTPAFLSIAALADGLDFMNEIGIDRINRHVSQMTGHLIDGLRSLRRRDGSPLVTVYGPGNENDRGATVAFNIRGRDRAVVPFAAVVDRARECGVSLRGGCFCNPGASEAAFEFPALSTGECLRSAAEQGFSIEKFAECMGPHIPVGAVRASLGVATNKRDVQRAVSVVSSFTNL